MNVFVLNKMSKEQKDVIMRRAEVDISGLAPLAREVSDDVRARGDDAIADYTEKFDRVKVNNIAVTNEQIEQGYVRLDVSVRDAIEYAARNIKKFHTAQMPQGLWFTDVDDGIMAGEKITPVSDVCLYVPRGKGSFPSVLLMLGIPAVVAGVKKIVVVTPPNEEGEIDDMLLAAARIIGVREIYKVGGIQAVAAVAFGTASIPKCSKIIGPGNAYVTAAKRALSGYIDIGLPAGPSEAIILADEHANPHTVALDWMIEAEHGPDSASLLVTHSRELVDRVIPIMQEELQKLSDKRRGFIETNFSTYGGVIITESLEESIDFVNEYAPEHMEILTAEPFAVLPKINNAGEILLGQYTPVTLCNYLLGPNAILPTGGHAKTCSAVSVHDFLKRSSVGYVTREGFLKVKEHAAMFAAAEGFDAHANAIISRRF